MRGTGSPRIDAHHHLWDLDRRAQPWIDHDVLSRSFRPQEYEVQLAAARFDGSVLVQNLCEEDETAELLMLAAENPRIRGVVGWVDLTGDVDDSVARLRELPGGHRLVGIRHQVQMEDDPDWLCRVAVRRGLERLAANGLPFDAVVRPDQLDSVVRSAQHVPALRWILDHLGNPLDGRGSDAWRTSISALGDLPNVAVKLSGLGNLAGTGWTADMVSPVVEHTIAAFGADRTMFGSDWPVCLITGDFAQVLAAAEQWCGSLEEHERAAVFGGTAERWYAL